MRAPLTPYPQTLRGRLVLAAVGSILAGLAALAISSVLIVSHNLRSSLDHALVQRAQQVAELAVSAPAVLDTPGALESPVGGHQIVVEVIDAHGRIIARSLTLGAELLPEGPLARAAIDAGRTGFENISIGPRRFRLYAAPIADAGGPASGGAVLVASDTTDIAGTISHLTFLVVVIGVGVAVAAAMLAAMLTARGLRPLRRLALAAEEIERTADPSSRLPEPSTADELAQLSGVLNRMLAALERSRENERRFLADASHELRTPVTALLGNVEYAVRHGAEPEVLADLRRDAARLARLVDDLLVLERAGAREREPAVVKLDELVATVVDGFGQANGRLVVSSDSRVAVRGDAEALRRLLDNLVENALTHGPEWGRVTVSVDREGDRALLTVRDEGPGPDPGDQERLFERFWRAPDAGQRPGSGLGLAIVKAIAEGHGGRVLVDGAAFTVELPALSGGESTSVDDG